MTPLQRILARVKGLSIDLTRFDAEKGKMSEAHRAWMMNQLYTDVAAIGKLLLEEGERIEQERKAHDETQ